MILPLGDSPNPRDIPGVTYALLALNIAAYIFITVPLSIRPPDPADPLLPIYVRTVTESLPQESDVAAVLRHTSAYDLFVYRHGFRPSAPHVSSLLFALFLHAGLLHLAGNMLFLWIYGDNVEHRLGHWRYLLAYLATGACASLFHTVFDLRSPLPLIGASGAISGVLGFYFLWFPRNSVRLLVLLPLLFDTITVSARLLLATYLLLDNVLPFLVSRGHASGGVAHGAHIGGFLAGVAAAWFIDRRELRTRPEEYATDQQRAPADGLNGLIDAGRFADAAEEYFALPAEKTRGLLSPAASLALANWLREHGHARAALVVYRRHLRDRPHDASAAEAHLGAGLVQLESFNQPTAAYQHFLDALELSSSSSVAARARAALDAITARESVRFGRLGRRG